MFESATIYGTHNQFDFSVSLFFVSLYSELIHIGTQLETIYSKAGLQKDDQTVLRMEPELTQLMARSRDYDELRWAWVGWRNATGKKMRTLYDRFVKLQNIGATDIGQFVFVLDTAMVYWL